MDFQSFSPPCTITQHPTPGKMTNKTKPSNLVDERKRTDDSLDAERDRSRKSLAETKLQTQTQTDDDIAKERAMADNVAETNRNNADLSRKEHRFYNTQIPPQSHTLDDQLLRNERLEVYAAVELERRNVDEAFHNEREVQGALLEMIITQERSLTDINLRAERTQTDSEIDTSSRQLNSEIFEHQITKTSLTTRDEFLAIFSHDLRNPIGTVSNIADMLLEEEAGPLTPTLKQWISAVKTSADSALRLISDILDIERISHNNLALNIKPNSIKKLFREASTGLLLQALEKQIDLQFIASKSSLDFPFDFDRISQVLSNLVTNAIKFTPKGGSISVRTTSTDAVLTVSVQDSGVGIPRNKSKVVFEKFAQLHDKDRRGLGLGLHISTMLVQAHGGNLSVVSEPGKGSTFSFTLPRDSAQHS